MKVALRMMIEFVYIGVLVYNKLCAIVSGIPLHLILLEALFRLHKQYLTIAASVLLR